MKKMKVGLVGCGVISDIYLANAAKFSGYDVVSVSDIRNERAIAQAEKYGIEKVYSYDEMLSDPEVDIIMNLTVHAAHTPLCMEALRAGKHIFNEKPLGATFEEAKGIIALAKEKGLYVGCAPDTILGGRTQMIRKCIDEGKIGFPVGGVAFMTCHGHECWHANPFFVYGPEGTGSGPIFDMGPYYLTTLVYLLGPVKRVSGMVSTPFKERVVTNPDLYGQKIKVEVPTNINGLIEFENGAIINTIITYDVWDSHLPRIEIFGSEGTISMCERDPLCGPDDFEGEIEYRYMDDSDWLGFPSTLPRHDATQWDRIQTVFGYNQNTRGVGVAEMVYSIQKGIRNIANGDLALHVMEIGHGIHESCRTGKYYEMTTTVDRPRALPEDHVEFSDIF